MMSFGGGWFFLAAAEAISRAQPQLRAARDRLLRRRGRRATATSAGRALAIVVMIVMVVGVNVLFWRPLVAWAEKFRVETSEATDAAPQRHVSTCCAAPRIPRHGRPAAAARSAEALDRVTRPFGLAEYPLHATRAAPAGRRRRLRRRRVGRDRVGASGGRCVYFNANVGFGEFPHVLRLGFVTFIRVVDPAWSSRRWSGCRSA